MPRTRLDKQPDPLGVLIRGTMAERDLSPETIDLPDMCPGTLRRRLANPSKFTIAEISVLCRRLGIPVEEARRAAIRY